jgi:RND superfamily putative drug exporter
VVFLSTMRRRLRRGQERLEAARAATAETAPTVLTAGLIIAAGTGALVVGELGFLKSFGPGLALTTLVALAVSITLIPALMALFGARLFGAEHRGRLDGGEQREGANGSAPPDRARRVPLRLSRPVTAMRRTAWLADVAQTSRWRLMIARIASSRPVALPIAVCCVVLLGALALGARHTELGLGFVQALPSDNEVRRAATAAGEGFAPGVLSPTEIDLEQPGIATRAAELERLEELLAREPGVAAVIGPRAQPPPPAPPVLVSEDNAAARYAVIFDVDPLGAPAIDRLEGLRERLPALLRESGLGAAPRVGVAGETALAVETVDRVVSDLWRIGLVALAVNLILLMVFLRAAVAPLYLLGASVLGLAASLGVTTTFFQGFLGHDDLTYYVPFAAAVLLVALGSDYNVFVAGRIWDEARWLRLREAIAVATPAAAKAITAAGVALAASFALLAIVPLRPFREFAFLMAVGVLIDTFVVRSLLVPALTSLFGEAAWWPGRRIRGLTEEAFVERVAGRAHLPWHEGRALTGATLATLGERITPRERAVLARDLPPELGEKLGEDRGPERFSRDEFLARVHDRAGGRDLSEAEMNGYVAAVMATLRESVPDDLAYARAQLSDDYDTLFADSRVSSTKAATSRS